MKRQCIFIGDSYVGKTSIIQSLPVNSEVASTIGVDVHHYLFNNIDLNIWDTTGNPNFHPLIRTFEKSCNTIVYVFAANDTN